MTQFYIQIRITNGTPYYENANTGVYDKKWQLIQLSLKSSNNNIYNNIYTNDILAQDKTTIVNCTWTTSYSWSSPGQTSSLYNHKITSAPLPFIGYSNPYPVLQCNITVNGLIYNAGRHHQNLAVTKPDPRCSTNSFTHMSQITAI